MNNCHNCKYFIEIKSNDDNISCGQCLLTKKVIIDADNENCQDYQKK